MAEERGDLAEIDAALLRLRRLWVSPRSRADMERDVGEGVALSHVLVVDAVARGRPRQVDVRAVAERLQVDRSTASRLVDAAVGAGYVERARCPSDSRRTILALTGPGAALFDRAVGFRLDHLDRLVGAWPARDRATLARLLARFADEVGRDGDVSERPHRQSE